MTACMAKSWRGAKLQSKGARRRGAAARARHLNSTATATAANRSVVPRELPTDKCRKSAFVGQCDVFVRICRWVFCGNGVFFCLMCFCWMCFFVEKCGFFLWFCFFLCFWIYWFYLKKLYIFLYFLRVCKYLIILIYFWSFRLTRRPLLRRIGLLLGTLWLSSKILFSSKKNYPLYVSIKNKILLL